MISKKHNPKFARQDAFNIKGINTKWRKPRGIASKVRMAIAGHRALVKIGHRNNKLIRNTHDGLKIAYINNLAGLQRVNPEESIIIVSSKTGFRKKQLILAQAKAKSIKLLNIKHPEDYITRIKAAMAKQAVEESAVSTKQPEAKKPEEKAKEQLSQKEQQAKQEQEKRKILEKPN
ncbi:MAG TPA: eL32 family ribosomal protein [Candidatus Nanoarchaeia archaeon]|nr:eL32 family ribosomal protein [Candidatus Nanoarchaeia archaeon]